MPHSADLKELARLRLNTLCRVNYHYGAVSRHKGAVGVLRKVLMPRGIENIYAKAFIFKLHDRRGNGNTALLFKIHPVGNRVLGRSLALYRACGLNSAAVQQKFFGQCGFTGVRVGYYSKRPSAFNFGFKVAHKITPL